jgi:hypothetical protein
MAVTVEAYYRDGLKRDGPVTDARFALVDFKPERVTPLDFDAFGNAYFVYTFRDVFTLRTTSGARSADTAVQNGSHYEIWV